MAVYLGADGAGRVLPLGELGQRHHPAGIHRHRGHPHLGGQARGRLALPNDLAHPVALFHMLGVTPEAPRLEAVVWPGTAHDVVDDGRYLYILSFIFWNKQLIHFPRIA